jgi:hypothetical protein
MWLIPRRSPFSHFVPGTAVSNLDYPEHWQTLCESLLWRSKPTPWRFWKQRLRRASWLSRLCGRTCEPSQQNDFEDALISSLRDTRASRSRSPGNAKENPTRGTFGRILRESCGKLSLFGASSRTSPDTLPLDSPEFTAAYKTWVTQLRQDCLQRQKSARPTNGNGCSSWPTPAAANYRDGKASPETMARNSRPLQEVVTSGPQAPASHSMTGKNPELWLTPHGFMGQGKDGNYGGGVEFAKQVSQWATPNDGGRVKGKLNPDWVEQLMGVPVHWTLVESQYEEAEEVLQAKRGFVQGGRKIRELPVPPDVPETLCKRPGVQESHRLRAGTDSGIAGKSTMRVDRLRLLGNGVVPAQAEKGFRTLMERFMP